MRTAGSAAPNKTNERAGVRAQAKYVRLSAYKAREVLDLIRGATVGQADEVLRFTERDAAIVIRKCLHSAVANAGHNENIPAEELFVAACYADEGPTLKRWRPRARGRATRIRKRTCHITIVVGRLEEAALDRQRERDTARAAAVRGARGARGGVQATAEARRRRVARSRGEDAAAAAGAAEAGDPDGVRDEAVDAAPAEASESAPRPGEGAEAVEAAPAEADAGAAEDRGAEDTTKEDPEEGR
ncbi:MAG: 50S ribosomal protein L22 [Acidimicrobiales bacterium]